MSMSFNLHFQTECDSLSVFCSAFRRGKAEIQTRPNWARKVHELIIYMGQNNSGYGAFAFYIPEKESRKKKRRIFREGKYIFVEEKKKRKLIFWGTRIKMEKDKEENIWRRDFLWRREKRRKKTRKMLGEGKDLFGGEGNILHIFIFCISCEFCILWLFFLFS